ncbi:MAG: NTP transferase domain-containing protein [Nanoarchaeota archaeon]|nr:NTP transferase domain-containing protein [Nanoarchaeota archaeon]
MKVVILAAGKGTRLRPYTDDTPKALVEIKGKPYLYYLMKNLLKSGFDDICILVGYKKEKFPEFLENYGFEAQLIEQKEQKGTADAVSYVKYFTGSDNFLLVYGDNLFSVSDLKSMDKDDEFTYLCGMKVEHPEKYGVIIMEGNNVVGIKEKPKEFYGNFVSAGMLKLTSEIYPCIDKIEVSPRGEFELPDAISMLIDEGKVKVNEVKDGRLDLGCVDDIKIVEDNLDDFYED